MLALGYALAALMGASLGLLGGGGSILTVPIFVYVLGFTPKLAIAMSLPVVGVTSVVGAVSHWRQGNVHLRVAGFFGIVAMAGAYTGARLAMFVTGEVQLILLAIIMIVAAVSMFRSAEPSPAPHRPDDRVIGPSLGVLALVALGVGILTGVVGIGGGFLVVPALVLLARVPITQAVGTALVVIALNCASGFAGYVGRVEIPWGFLVGFTAMASVGILIGSWASRHVSQLLLKKSFAIFLVLMGAFVLWRNSGLLPR